MKPKIRVTAQGTTHVLRRLTELDGYECEKCRATRAEADHFLSISCVGNDEDETMIHSTVIRAIKVATKIEEEP